MYLEQMGGTRFRTPAGHGVPMGGRGSLLMPFALSDRIWVAAVILVGSLAVCVVGWLVPAKHAVIACALAFALACVCVVFVAHVVDYARCVRCGSDGLWILLQTVEGIGTISAATRLSRERLRYERGMYEETFLALRRWEDHLKAERVLYATQQRIIHTWLNSGRPYGPPYTRLLP